MSPESEEKIILALIEEGGNAPAHCFSLSEVARKSGVKEKAIRERYQSESLLLNAGDAYLSARLFTYAEEAAKSNATFASFFSDLMVFQIRHPSWNGFWLNYSSAFPRFPNEKEENPVSIPLGLLQALQKFFPAKSYQGLEGAFRFIIRETICFARYVIYSEVPGNVHRLEAESRLVYGGLSAFLAPKKN
jgi:hypothetical protein